MAPARCVALLAAAACATAAPATYTNPVIGTGDTPDPGVAWDPATGLWWAATTGGGPGTSCFALHSSPDLGNWTPAGYAFPDGQRPSWIVDSCWAPEYHFIGGKWLLYFVGRHANTKLLSVGVAVSTTGSIAGPYVDAIGAPLVTDAGAANPQGQIDPTVHQDADGSVYLVWKTDGNADGQPTPIRVAKLTPNGTALAPGQPDWHTTQLIVNDQPWEGPIVEAPWVVQYAGSYYLFYSANGYWSVYAVGVARASSITGPYTKHAGPILHNATVPVPPFQAPGHCSVVQARDGNWAIVYHAWDGAERSQRHMMLDKLTWVPDGAGGYWPAIGADGSPSTGPQTLP